MSLLGTIQNITTITPGSAGEDALVQRVREALRAQAENGRRSTSETFAWLILLEWWAITLFSCVTAHDGAWAAFLRTSLVGAAIVSVPLAAIIVRPSAQFTKYVVGIAQLLLALLAVHTADGAAEAHFGVFVSLALLAFYRDGVLLAWMALVAVLGHVAVDTMTLHAVSRSHIALLPYAAWIAFADIGLIVSVTRSRREHRAVAERHARLEMSEDLLKAAATELEEAIEERTNALMEAELMLGREVADKQRMEIELRMAQKLEAIGQLAAGVAHEINTPIQYVGDSITFLQSSFTDLDAVLERYRVEIRRLNAANQAPGSAALSLLSAAEQTADLEFVRGEVPLALERALDGVRRVARIVRAMKDLAHPDGGEQSPVDVNRLLDSSLTVSRNEYKYVADVETEFCELPQVVCHAGELSQVVLNLIVNAAHAIESANAGSEKRGLIRVRTASDGANVRIEIQDSGCGIPEKIRDRIFDPFFTTKEVGKGTGQGLSIARAAIERHRGTLTFETEIGVGTTFIIHIPIAGLGKEAA